MRDDEPVELERDEAAPQIAQLTAALLNEPEVGEEHREQGAPTAAFRWPIESAIDGTAETTSRLSGAGGIGMPANRVAAAVVAAIVLAALAGTAAFATLSSPNLVPRSPAPSSAASAYDVAALSASPRNAAGSDAAGSPSAETTEAAESLAPEPTEIVLRPTAGKMVFGDDFRDGSGGWPTAATTLTSFTLGVGTYAVVAKGSGVDHLVEAPYSPRLPQIAVNAVANQSSGRGTAGFGVTCGATTTPIPESSLLGDPSASANPASPTPAVGPQEVLYEFIVLNSGGWLVERRDGPPANSVQPVVLMHGATTVVPGTRPMTVSGICASTADGARVRLILTIDGLKVIEFSDASAVVTEGWRGGLVVSTVNTAANVQFHHFEVRDLAATP